MIRHALLGTNLTLFTLTCEAGVVAIRWTDMPDVWGSIPSVGGWPFTLKKSPKYQLAKPFIREIKLY